MVANPAGRSARITGANASWGRTLETRRTVPLVVLTAVLLALGLIWPVGAAQTAMVTATIFSTWDPSTVTIDVGDSVMWMNLNGSHTVTSSSSNWSYRTTTDATRLFDQPGTYDYFCEIHAGMTGRVIVRGAASGTATNTPVPTSTPVPTTAAVSTGSLFALLTGANEVPATTSSGTGSVTLTLNADTGVITGSWNATGLTSSLTAAHIHRGAPRTSGPIVVPFSNPPTTGGSYSTSTSSVDPALIREILANPGGFYVNIHTTNNPTGEVRGWLGSFQACTTGALGATLQLSNEVPPHAVGAEGMVTLAFDLANGMVSGQWQVGTPSSNFTAAHIHQNAAGVNGPVVVPFSGIPVTGGAFSTSTTGQASQLLTNILNNPSAFYVNMHTSTNPGGETRGQLGCIAAANKVFLPIDLRNREVS
jgi:plastocyanin